jgi:hypothetical protein
LLHLIAQEKGGTGHVENKYSPNLRLYSSLNDWRDDLTKVRTKVLREILEPLSQLEVGAGAKFDFVELPGLVKSWLGNTYDLHDDDDVLRHYKRPQFEQPEREDPEPSPEEADLIALVKQAPRNTVWNKDMPAREELGRRYPQVFAKKGFFRSTCSIGQIKEENGGLSEILASYLTTLTRSEKAARDKFLSLPV